jgi:Xaa-Pro aminopeptidase
MYPAHMQSTIWAAAALALGGSAWAQGDVGAPNGTSVERPGDGRPTGGLGKSFHSGRRAALRAKLGEGLVVLRGLEETRDYTRFHQDKVFWYLTGIDSPGAALVMDLKSGAETLYLPKLNKRGEMWEGEKWDCSDAWVSELTGFTEIRCSDALDEDLGKQIDKGERVWVSLHPAIALSACFDRAVPFDNHIEKDPLDGRLSREKALKANLERLYGADVKDLSDTLVGLRQIKQPEEIAAMRAAGRSGALAMVEAMRSTRAGVGEWELEGLMSWVQIRNGATGPGYHGIVGSGPNSLVLHYSTSRRTLQPSEMILIDYAPEVDHFVSDITRSWPVDGAFSARQAELYDAVLASQAAGIAAVKPGIVLADVEKVCKDVLTERGLAEFIRHGTCHWIGLEVHDPGDYSAALVPGMAFTVEPGLYEPATGIGIRIEDVVLVTPEGCEVLSALVPKQRAEIEQLIAAQGVLDWLDRPDAGAR